MDKSTIGKAMDVVKKRVNIHEKSQEALEHSIIITFKPFRSEDPEEESGNNKDPKRRGYNCSSLGLDMQSCGFSITLFQLKLKVVEFTQTWPLKSCI
jgi:hypothetical protein